MQLDKFVRLNNRGRSGLFVFIWFFVQGTFFRLSGYPLNSWRCFLLRLFGARVGKKVIIRPSVKVHFPWKVEIGDNCMIGDEAWIYSLDKILIGRNCVISQRAFLCSGTHDFNKPAFDLVTKQITVEESTWICANVFVHPGVTVGKNCVIGAMSNVTDNIPDNSICFGNPCKVVKKKNEM